MKKFLCFVCTATLLFAMSCQRNEDALEVSPVQISGDAKVVVPAVDHYGQITDKDIDELHERVSAFSEVLKKMYADENVVSEVNEFIGTGFYSDENIVLKDLLSPEASPWFKNARLKTSGNFKTAFQTEYTKLLGSNPRLRTAQGDFSDYLVENGVAIYFPYSDKHQGKKYDEITIVMPPKEDVNQAPGIRLKKCGKDICEEKVVVDDAYAIQHPTHIICVGGADVKKKYTNKLKGSRTNSISTVFLGAIRCKKQYDALVSFTGNGNGSEIKVFRGSGYLSYDPNGQITNITGDLISIDISRSDISSCNPININAIWDLDWEVDNKEQVFGIYEEDTKGEATFTGSVNTTLSVGGQKQNGSLGYSIKVQTQDEIIRNWKISRNAFYIANPNSQGHGTYYQVGNLTGGPWASWDGQVVGCNGANVSFVLPTVTQ